MTGLRRIIAAIVLLVAACEKPAPRVDPAVALREAEDEVSRRLLGYPEFVKSYQLDSVMSFWARDARIFENDRRVFGDSTLRAIGEKFFPEYDVTRLVYAPTETTAQDTGSAVYQFGYVTEDIQKKGQKQVSNTGKNFVARWTRDASGKWRMHRFLTTPAPRPSAPSATVQPLAPASSPRPDAATIQQRLRDYAMTLASSDPAAILAFWADDGRYLQPGIELNDKPALVRFVNDAYARAKVAAAEITSEELFLHDGVAYQLGTCHPCLVPGAAGRAHYYIARWKSSPGGTWLLDRFLATLAPAEGSRASK